MASVSGACEQTAKRIITLRRECPKMTIVRAYYRTRQVPNENTKKGVSTIHECGLCGIVDTLCEYVSCFMFYVFAFTCHIQILKVIERSLHALPRNRVFLIFVGSETLFSGCRLSVFHWIFAISFCVFEVTKNPVAISTALRSFGT